MLLGVLLPKIPFSSGNRGRRCSQNPEWGAKSIPLKLSLSLSFSLRSDILTFKLPLSGGAFAPAPRLSPSRYKICLHKSRAIRKIIINNNDRGGSAILPGGVELLYFDLGLFFSQDYSDVSSTSLQLISMHEFDVLLLLCSHILLLILIWSFVARLSLSLYLSYIYIIFLSALFYLSLFLYFILPQRVSSR